MAWHLSTSLVPRRLTSDLLWGVCEALELTDLRSDLSTSIFEIEMNLSRRLLSWCLQPRTLAFERPASFPNVGDGSFAADCIPHGLCKPPLLMIVHDFPR
jgi:hypothetical protein